MLVLVEDFVGRIKVAILQVSGHSEAEAHLELLAVGVKEVHVVTIKPLHEEADKLLEIDIIDRLIKVVVALKGLRHPLSFANHLGGWFEFGGLVFLPNPQGCGED